MNAMSCVAPVKLNLFLHIIGRRPDGYHELQSLFVFADFGDEIAYEPGPEPLHLAVDGPFAADAPAGGDNLVLRAAAALSPAATGRLRLTKNVPVASGIGGGSADAAATLLLLNRALKLDRDPLFLHQAALALGADVPACLIGVPCFVSGIGDRLTKIENYRPIGCLLVNPGVPLSTAQVFKAYAQSTGAHRTPIAPWPPTQIDLAAQHNDLEPSARALEPQIAAILGELRAQEGCRLARMSGSGATCFGLFSDVYTAEAASTGLAAAHPLWWSRPTTIMVPETVTGLS